MLTTLHLSETETARWLAGDRALITEVRGAAAAAARRTGRRFWQIRGADRRCLAVGEISC